jgi:two-component system sensor histidine kinase PilS (NtrC family)
VTDTALPGELSYGNSLSFLALYRVFVAAVLVVLLLAGGADSVGFGSIAPVAFGVTAVSYLLVAIVLLVLCARLAAFGSTLLTLGVLIDVVAIIVMMDASGGFRTGMAVLLLFSIAGAAILSDRTMTLFHAASASIGLLVSQANAIITADQPSSLLVQPGLLSTGYFAIGIIVNRLAEKVIRSEREAIRRGRELESQLRLNELVIQDMPDGVIVLDGVGRVVLVNRAAEEAAGVAMPAGTPLASISGALAACLAHWRDRPGASTGSAEILLGRQRVRPRFIAGGTASRERVLALLEDVSRLEEQGRQQKLVALGRLTANLAHEIRNPLSAILHATDLLDEETDALARARLVQIARSNIQRLDRMVSDVMQLGRRDRTAPERVVLAAWLSTFAGEFMHAEKLPAGALVSEIDDVPPIRCDPVHLNQILWNLLHNAWRHGGGGLASVCIRAHRSEGGVAIDVVDAGRGIDPDVRTQIFEPFFTTFSRGTGLGLYIARELAEANGATLRYCAEESATTFRLLWPREALPV